jgi:hypothetical protein
MRPKGPIPTGADTWDSFGIGRSVIYSIPHHKDAVITISTNAGTTGYLGITAYATALLRFEMREWGRGARYPVPGTW